MCTACGASCRSCTARLLGVDRRTIQRWLGEAQTADDDDDRKVT